MFCNKCGAEIEAGNLFCQKCGEKLSIMEENGQKVMEAGQQTDRLVAINDSQTKKCRRIGVVVVGIIVVIAIVLGIQLFGGRSEKSTIKRFVDGQMKGDGKELVSLFPQELINGICEEEGYLNTREMILVIEEQLQEQREQVDDTYGKGWKYSYEIVETEDYSIEDLRDMRQDYQEDYDIKLSIEAAKEVKIEITTSSKDGKNSSTSAVTIDIIKIGGSWYINGL